MVRTMLPMPPSGSPVEPRSTCRRGSCAASILDDASDIGRASSQDAEPGERGPIQFDTTPSWAMGGLEARRLQVLVQQVGHAAEEHLGEGLLIFRCLQARTNLAQSGRRLEDRDPETLREAIEEVEQGGVAVDVLLRELADLSRYPLRLPEPDERAPVGKGEHERGVRPREGETEALELQVRDDLRLERAGRVGHRRAVAGEKLVLRAGAADDMALLEHEHIDARAGEVGRRR